MKQLWTILLALFLLLPTLAQEDVASAAFERLIPSNVRLRLSEETGASLIFNAVPAVCEPLIVDISVEGNIIDVDAYSPIPAEGETCNFIAPYEPVIELGQLEPDESYVLLLNDFATMFFLPQVQGMIMDMPFPMIWGEDNPLYGFTRVDAFIDSAELSLAEDDTVSAHLLGSHPDGCISDTFTWIRQDDIDETIYHIEVFRLIPEGVMCPMQLQDLEMTVNTGLPADGNYYIEAGDNWFSYSSYAASQIINLPITIDTVTIVPEGTNFDVTVTGSTLDCGVELSQTVAVEAYATFIDLSLFMPLDTSCSNGVIPYEELFHVDMLPVIINGVAYDENGILSPSSGQSISPEPSQGGNLMKVDTVIESVDVLILESFPMQLDLVVKGYQPDGCEVPVVVEQQREGNLVTVHIYRELAPDVMCTMMIIPYEETIRLEGGFEGGTIEIHVNEFTTTVDL